MEKTDFVAIGDITTDAFIELKDAEINCSIPENQEMLCLRFGDKVPYESVVIVPAVGNSPNAAVSAHRLGLASALATNLGDDNFGKEDLETLKNEGVDTRYLKVHEGKQSNYHFVLRHKAERTILVKHYEYDYALPEFEPSPLWFYLSSLGENSLPFHHEIAAYVREHNVKLAFQPGTFQIKLGYQTLKDIYEVSELFFCNREEAKRVLEMPEESDITTLLHAMHERGPRIVVITDGPKGAYTYDGSESWYMPMYPDPAPPVDRTGAGDSFSSTFTAALALGHDIPTALSWGPVNSMSVVQYIGAQKGLLTREALEEHLKKAPPDYKPEKMA
jgi:sugar/nucleoside kinase (ribokinase family)